MSVLLEHGSRKPVVCRRSHGRGKAQPVIIGWLDRMGCWESRTAMGKKVSNESKWANGSVGSGLVESGSCDSGPVKIPFAAGAGVPGFALVDATDSARAESG
jgi:hypothetical protein